MLRGIDISSWQTGIDLRNVIVSNAIDFVVIKATEGCAFVEDTCDYWVQTCISNGTLWGFYHFARHNDPEEEARYFVRACEGYFGHGIPVLDTETGQTGEWCQRFVDTVHALTGVYPIIYMSSNSGQRGKFEGTQVPSTCGLWEAFYPSASCTSFEDMPEYEGGTSPWAFGAMWQFTSNGRLAGYAYDLDLDVAWMDKEGWLLYADPEHEEAGNTSELPSAGNLHTFEDDAVKVTVEVKKQ